MKPEQTGSLTVLQVILSEEQVALELSQGHPIICSVGPGDFTKIGHFIVLTGYENGNVKVNDPFSIKNSKATWVFANIKDQIKSDVGNFSKKNSYQTAGAGGRLIFRKQERKI